MSIIIKIDIDNVEQIGERVLPSEEMLRNVGGCECTSAF